MKNTNWKDVEGAKPFELLPAGGYICQILRVEDNEGKEYLSIEFDIAEGPYTDHFVNQASGLQFWPGTFIKSYKQSAQRFFKSMLTAIEESNQNFRADEFTNNPLELENKRIGLVIGHEKYWNQKGEEKTRINVALTLSVQSIRSGDYKIPELKVNEYNKPMSGFTALPDGDMSDDVPF